MNIVGLDLSLTGTGICCEVGTSTIKYKWKTGDPEEPRLAFILSEVLDACHDADLVGIEGLAFASNTGKSNERAGLHFLVRMGLWQINIPFVLVPPTTVKMWATGSGRADKDEVLLSVVRNFPKIEVQNNNEADAVSIYTLVKEAVGESLVSLPATHRRALDKLVLPEGF